MTFSDCAFATLNGANISISWSNKILIVVSCIDLINAKVPASCQLLLMPHPTTQQAVVLHTPLYAPFGEHCLQPSAFRLLTSDCFLFQGWLRLTSKTFKTRFSHLPFNLALLSLLLSFVLTSVVIVAACSCCCCCCYCRACLIEATY